MKIEETGKRKRKRERKKERKRGDFYSPLSSEHSHFDVLRPFFFEKLQITITLLRNDDYGKMSGNFISISIILSFLSERN